MASTGVQNGTDLLVYNDGTAIGHATSCSINWNRNVRNTSSKQSGIWSNIKMGRFQPVTVSTEHLHAEDSTEGLSEQLANLTAGTSVTLKYSTEVTGDKYYTGSFYVVSINRNDPDDDNSTFTIEFQSDGTVTESTVT